jgi:hypothetical protein
MDVTTAPLDHPDGCLGTGWVQFLPLLSNSAHESPCANTSLDDSGHLRLFLPHAAGGARAAKGLLIPFFFLWTRIRSTTTGSVITEIILSSPPHGQTSGSTS